MSRIPKWHHSSLQYVMLVLICGNGTLWLKTHVLFPPRSMSQEVKGHRYPEAREPSSQSSSGVLSGFYKRNTLVEMNKYIVTNSLQNYQYSRRTTPLTLCKVHLIQGFTLIPTSTHAHTLYVQYVYASIHIQRHAGSQWSMSQLTEPIQSN